MAPPNIAIVIPLADVCRTRKAGDKARSLSRLISAQLAVPGGFVVSSDAYRAHLWSCGVRDAAGPDTDAESREQIRAAILSQALPEDIRQAISAAHERLSRQIGEPEPKLAVRPSCELSAAEEDFPGAYETYLNVYGLDPLLQAVKRVWASVWGGKAAAYRARAGGTSEPAMAVVVQQMVEARVRGVACTADPLVGDPNRAVVSWESADGDSGRVVFDLAGDWSGESGSAPVELGLVVERAIMAEEVIGGCVELEWAHDGEQLWALQVRAQRDRATCFPSGEDASSGADGVWRLDSPEPVSHFSRSLLFDQRPGRVRKRNAEPTAGSRAVIGGRVYACLNEPAEPKSRFARYRARRAEVRDASRRLSEWRDYVGPDVQTRAGRIVRTGLQDLRESALRDTLEEAAELYRRAADWTVSARHCLTASVAVLRETVSDDEELHTLLDGTGTQVVTRDSGLQDLAERLADARRAGRLRDERWFSRFQSDVRAFAADYGFSFRGAREMWDPGAWASWLEEPRQLLTLLAIVARRQGGTSLAVLNAGAADRAGRAEAAALGRLGGARRRFVRDVVSLSRGWMASACDAECSLALAATALRLVLAELGSRMSEAGLLRDTGDVFLLRLEELLSSSREPTHQGRARIASTIADRKHRLWLEARLIAPETLPQDHSDSSLRGVGSSPRVLAGIPSGTQSVTGRARVVGGSNDEAEIEPGDILVVRYSGLGWTPLLSVAGGFVSEDGDATTYPASLARLYGIPAVLGCRGATAVIKDGGRVALDGAAGQVVTPRGRPLNEVRDPCSSL